VAQINSHTWAIGIRGFTDKYGDKVLAMIDGRSVYSPLSSGVDWDQQDVPLEDIDRIEVIRGPGGTIWGANAVNGVINIITKASKATAGGLITGVAGTQRDGQGLVQYGGQAGPNGDYRVFGSYANLGNSPAPGGEASTDKWHKSHAGIRSDWKLSPQDSLTVQGDFLQSSEAQTLDTLLDSQLPSEVILGRHDYLRGPKRIGTVGSHAIESIEHILAGLLRRLSSH
jgi:iron complex outermembrane recepter protein